MEVAKMAGKMAGTQRFDLPISKRKLLRNCLLVAKIRNFEIKFQN